MSGLETEDFVKFEDDLVWLLLNPKYTKGIHCLLISVVDKKKNLKFIHELYLEYNILVNTDAWTFSTERKPDLHAAQDAVVLLDNAGGVRDQTNSVDVPDLLLTFSLNPIREHARAVKPSNISPLVKAPTA